MTLASQLAVGEHAPMRALHRHFEKRAYVGDTCANVTFAQCYVEHIFTETSPVFNVETVDKSLRHNCTKLIMIWADQGLKSKHLGVNDNDSTNIRVAEYLMATALAKSSIRPEECRVTDID